MQINEAAVRKIAHLARIKVTDEEAKSLEGELSAILTWVGELDEVDTENVEPMTSAVETEMKQRDDVVTDGGYATRVTKNAPLSEDHFFLVPKVVE